MHENNGKPEALLWIDFETTGVDRRSTSGHQSRGSPSTPH